MSYFFASQVYVFFALIEPIKSMLCSTHVLYGTAQKSFTCNARLVQRLQRKRYIRMLVADGQGPSIS